MHVATEIILSIIGIISGGFGAMGTAIAFLFTKLVTLQKAIEKERDTFRNEVSELRGQLLAQQVLSEVAQKSQMGGTPITSGEITVDMVSGTIKEWSPGATALLGWTARDMIGQSVMHLIPRDHREKQRTAVKILLATGAAPRHGPHRLSFVHQTGALIKTLTTLWGSKRSDGVYLVTATFTQRVKFGNDPGSDAIEVDGNASDPPQDQPAHPGS